MSLPRLTLGMSLSLLLLVLSGGEVFAHADLLGSDPAANSVVAASPERVRLFFSEPVQAQFFALEVYGLDRRRVDRDDARVSPNDVRVVEATLSELRDGAYTVTWRVLSLDDHVVRGSFIFGVGSGTTLDAGTQSRPGALDASFVANAAIRWLTYAAAFVLLGGFGFRAFVGPVPTGRADAVTSAAIQRRWLWVSWGVVTILILAAFGALLVQAAALGGVSATRVLDGQELTKLLASRYGYLWAGRVVQLLGVVAVLAVIGVTPNPRAPLWWLGAALSSGVLGTISASGHTNSVHGPTLVLIAVDWLHLAAGGLWVGGLVHLMLVLAAAMGGGSRRATVLGDILPRFSWYAGLSVVVLVLTGGFQAVLYVGSWAALGDTWYGAALSTKALLIAPLLLLAGVNLLVMSPRLRAGARARRATRTQRSFRYLLGGELVLVLGVLVASAVLTGLPPASTLPPPSAPFSGGAHTFSYAVELGVTPNQVGENTVKARVTNHLGVPSDVDALTIRLVPVELEAGIREVALEQLGLGRFTAPKAVLNAPGRWEAVVTVRQAGRGEEARFGFTVGRAAVMPAYSPVRALAEFLTIQNARAVLAVALIALGLVVLAQVARRYGLRSSGGLVRIGVVLLTLALAFLFVFGRSNGQTSQNMAFAANPIPATQESLAIGEAVYRVECQSCHGVTGRGDGPAGVLVRPPPADFRIHMAAGHTDSQLFNWLSSGVEGTAMPAYGERLSIEERWHVLNFIRTFALPGR